MTAATAAPAISPASPPVARTPSPFWPTFVWCALQVGVIGLGVCRVPLAARWPVPAERLALHEMAIAQVVGAAVLLPLLFRTFTAGAIVVVTAPLFDLLAAAVGAYGDVRRMIAGMVYVGLWLIALGVWSAALRTPRARAYLAAAAASMAVGGGLLAYVRREFVDAATAFDWSHVSAAGPVSGVVAILEAGWRSGTVWAELGFVLISGLLTAVFTRLLPTRRAKPVVA